MNRLTRFFLLSLQMLALSLLLSGSLRALQMATVQERELDLEHRITRLEALTEANTWWLKAIAGGMAGIVSEIAGRHLRRIAGKSNEA